MRWFGLLVAGAIIAVLAASGLLARAGAPSPTGADSGDASGEPVASASSAPDPTIEPRSALPEDEPETAVPEPPVEVAAPTTVSAGRRYRRRDRYWLDMPFSPANWAPPEGPVRIALQAGHWRANEAPEELSGLRRNGARANGTEEWQVNLEIANRTAAMLRGLGYEVDVLPAVVPPAYRAHLFISIHADGSADPGASGYRVASPRRDVTGRASDAAALLERSYGEATGLRRLPTVTRRMSNYYAFNFGRYQHALHPQTIGVILETGFLTSAADRSVIVQDPERAARGIVAAVTAFPETPPPLAGAAVVTGGAQ